MFKVGVCRVILYFVKWGGGRVVKGSGERNEVRDLSVIEDRI